MPALPLLLIAGISCADVNEPPRFLAVNDQEVIYLLGQSSLAGRLNVLPGDRLELRLTVEEPEGQPVSIWWPGAPMGLTWSSDSLFAAWDVPADWWSTENTLTVLALDDADPPAGAALEIEVNVALEEAGGGDTGATVNGGR